MAKKDFRKELGGIGGGAMGLIRPTTATEPPQQVKAAAAATGSNKKKKVCLTLCEENLLKLKTIGANNGLPINSLIDKAISRAIEQYEKANGEIIITNSKIDDIF